MKKKQKDIYDIFLTVLNTYCKDIMSLFAADELISFKVIRKYLDYLDKQKSRENNLPSEWHHIFDCLIKANEGQENAKKYLQFLSHEFSDTFKCLESINASPHNLNNYKSKLKDVFNSHDFNAVINCQSLNYANEIFSFSKILKQSIEKEYRFKKFEFNLNNGKNLDFAFEKNGRLICIECKSIHRILLPDAQQKSPSPDVVEKRLIKKIKNKIISKGLKIRNGKFYYEGNPDMEIYLLICLTDEYVDLQKYKETFKVISKKYDMMVFPLQAIRVDNNGISLCPPY